MITFLRLSSDLDIFLVASCRLITRAFTVGM
ncbi:Uncharacterised protein [Vibrio cholerae]|nr:Uncharacterised protein [Vibrio cholerae]